MIEPGHPGLSVVRQCALVSISRSGFYLSTGMEWGPPIGVQKGPLSLRLVPVVHRGDPRAAECPTRG